MKKKEERLKKIVVNEQLCLLTAKYLGIEITESFIVTTDGDDENVLFATKRYDRKFMKDDKMLNGMPVPRRLHQEDFAQALGIAAANKYEKNNEGYLKKLFDVIRSHSADPMTDSLKLWDICIFNYLIGNTDNHIKNLSLLYSEGLKIVRLAPAYDIVSTIIYKSSTENMALSIDGICNINDITRASFEATDDETGCDTIETITQNVIDDTFAVNVRGSILMTREFIKHRGDYGRIINISTDASKIFSNAR